MIGSLHASHFLINGIPFCGVLLPLGVGLLQHGGVRAGIGQLLPVGFLKRAQLLLQGMEHLTGFMAGRLNLPPGFCHLSRLARVISLTLIAPDQLIPVHLESLAIHLDQEPLAFSGLAVFVVLIGVFVLIVVLRLVVIVLPGQAIIAFSVFLRFVAGVRGLAVIRAAGVLFGLQGRGRCLFFRAARDETVVRQHVGDGLAGLVRGGRIDTIHLCWFVLWLVALIREIVRLSGSC
ncbi:MAG: hypothetical protein U1E60_14675 [Reyranellaceae bacterium]